MESVMEVGEEYFSGDIWKSEIDISQLCRVCANTNEYLIPIFQGEGLEHELKNKISKHLPIQVSEDDKLPTHLCYQCASTIIAWHDLVVACVEAEHKFKKLTREDEQSTDKNDVQTTTTCKLESKADNQSVEVANQLENDMNVEDESVIQTETVLGNTADDPGSIIIEGVTSMESVPLEEVPSDLRCLDPFNAYHQTQTALRTIEWVSIGCVFCILCGKMKQNHMMLVKHLSLEHTVHCGYCRARFGSEDRLSTHMMVHDKIHSIPIEVGEENCSILEKLLNKETQCQSNVNNKTDNVPLPKNVSSKGPFHCEVCSSIFSRRFDLKRHKLKHHSIEHLSEKENSKTIAESLEVELCDSRGRRDNIGTVQDVDEKYNFEDDTNYTDSVNSEDISRHLDVKIDTFGMLDYSCSQCNLTFATKQDLMIHQKEHKVKKKRKYRTLGSEKIVNTKQFSCSLCNNLYSRSCDLQKHVYKKHGGDKIVKRCVDFVDDMDVKIINEARRDINGTVVYYCNLCDKNIRTRRGLVRHIRVHTGERPFTCHMCGKQYRSNADLTRHLRCVHDGVKNYQCDICSRYFASKGTRNDHRRTHTGERPYVCHVCGKAFPTPNSIYVHRRIHSDYFPHSCSTCGKKFRRKQQLVNHSRTHTGEKPYSCDICGKCFCTKDDVSRHKLTHSNNKPHICNTCGIRFGQKRYLSNHMKTNHKAA